MTYSWGAADTGIEHTEIFSPISPTFPYPPARIFVFLWLWTKAALVIIDMMMTSIPIVIRKQYFYNFVCIMGFTKNNLKFFPLRKKVRWNE